MLDATNRERGEGNRGMRVMTWNIRHGLGTDPETGQPDDEPDLERIARIIDTYHPDVVGLQELDHNWARSGHVDQTSWLANRLGVEAVFGPNLVDGDTAYGVAIFSRYRIIEHANIPLPGGNGLEPRGCLTAILETPEGEIAFLCTHLQVTIGDDGGAGARERADGARSIARRIANAPERPAILVGDFNADPDAEELGALKGLQDAWRIADGGGTGYTIPAHPSNEASARIDAIYVTAGWEIDRTLVARDDQTRLASDHYPVIADLSLRRER